MKGSQDYARRHIGGSGFGSLAPQEPHNRFPEAMGQQQESSSTGITTEVPLRKEKQSKPGQCPPSGVKPPRAPDPSQLAGLFQGMALTSLLAGEAVPDSGAD